MDKCWSERLENAYRNGQMVGWDFSRLDGRMTAQSPNWDFDAMCLTALSEAASALDVGTGGGERLIELCHRLGADRPAFLLATEGWSPNIPVAREALAPLGIEVVEYDADQGAPMPVEDASVDLVMVRHEAFDADEVARILRPGGLLLTQQVHTGDAAELRDWFGGQPAYPDTTLEHDVAAAASAGLILGDQDEWCGRMQFRDAETLVEYMALVPWDVPGFTVGAHLLTLADLDQEPPIEVTQHRYWFSAHQPR